MKVMSLLKEAFDYRFAKQSFAFSPTKAEPLPNAKRSLSIRYGELRVLFIQYFILSFFILTITFRLFTKKSA